MRLHPTAVAGLLGLPALLSLPGCQSDAALGNGPSAVGPPAATQSAAPAPVANQSAEPASPHASATANASEAERTRATDRVVRYTVATASPSPGDLTASFTRNETCGEADAAVKLGERVDVWSAKGYVGRFAVSSAKRGFCCDHDFCEYGAALRGGAVKPGERLVVAPLCSSKDICFTGGACIKGRCAAPASRPDNPPLPDAGWLRHQGYAADLFTSAHDELDLDGDGVPDVLIAGPYDTAFFALRELGLWEKSTISEP